MSTNLPRRVCRSLLVASAVCAWLLCEVGCRTQEDASAAASQMAATAQTLSAYYAALDHVVAQTRDTYQAQLVLQGVPAMDLAETRKQIKMRQEMATEIVGMASLFQKLTGSSAAKDSGEAAGRLNDQVVSMTAMANNGTETKALAEGIHEIVSLIQQHEEVQAAKKMGPLCHNLSAFFDSESAAYDALNQSYLLTAKSVSEVLVQRNEVDVSHIFAAALQPFGLSASVEQKAVNAQMQSYLLKQIGEGYASGLADSQKATKALSAALKEMDTRVSLVAGDKPMKLRMVPLSLATVQSWIKQVAG